VHKPFFHYSLFSHFETALFQRLTEQLFVRQFNIRHIRFDFDRFEAIVAR
jgi:hypothetical protein